MTQQSFDDVYFMLFPSKQSVFCTRVLGKINPDYIYNRPYDPAASVKTQTESTSFLSMMSSDIKSVVKPEPPPPTATNSSNSSNALYMIARRICGLDYDPSQCNKYDAVITDFLSKSSALMNMTRQTDILNNTSLDNLYIVLMFKDGTRVRELAIDTLFRNEKQWATVIELQNNDDVIIDITSLKEKYQRFYLLLYLRVKYLELIIKKKYFVSEQHNHTDINTVTAIQRDLKRDNRYFTEFIKRCCNVHKTSNTF